MLWKKCVFCWTEERLSLDHIKPVSKWWWNEDDNLQVLCVSCNSKKHNKI
jgi:5-methylcytosine-specific restriction endonuclease McrA